MAIVIACGALARELVFLQRQNEWAHIKIQCLPARLHNTPEKIPDAVAGMIEKFRDKHAEIFVAYADCGTGGKLDQVLKRYGVSRLAGAHCYEFFAGTDTFLELCEAEPGTFYLTDFLVRHFDRLVIAGLGMDLHPELKAAYFGNYRRLVYLAQTESQELEDAARDSAAYLNLSYERRFTGLNSMRKVLHEQVIRWQN